MALDGRRVVSESYDRTLRVLDVRTGECQSQCVCATEVMELVALDTSRVVFAGRWGALYVWDVDSGQVPFQIPTFEPAQRRGSQDHQLRS